MSSPSVRRSPTAVGNSKLPANYLFSMIGSSNLVLRFWFQEDGKSSLIAAFYIISEFIIYRLLNVNICFHLGIYIVSWYEVVPDIEADLS
jgi:hypothetical protein